MKTELNVPFFVVAVVLSCVPCIMRRAQWTVGSAFFFQECRREEPARLSHVLLFYCFLPLVFSLSPSGVQDSISFYGKIFSKV